MLKTKKGKISDFDVRETSCLKRRYLTWLYKITKESLDRIDRKFTQLDIDKKILKMLADVEVLEDKVDYQKLLGDFKNYIDKKEKDAINLKYAENPKHLKADYLFLRNKMSAIEKLIINEFGKEEFRHIKSLYQDEMIRRIIEEREHK